jgi:SSS family solute:Na+ symporter
LAKALFPDVMPDKAYAIMVLNILPVGVSGVVLAGLLAAIMSSLDSAFCATSSIMAMDFFQKVRKNASEKELVRFGQIAGGVIFALSMAWAPSIRHFGLLYVYLLSYYAYIASPFVACFLFGILSKRLNRIGAFVTITSGLVLGLGLMVATSLESMKVYLPVWLVEMHFYHLNIWLFLIAVATLFIVSYLTPPPIESQLAALRKPAPAQREPSRPWHLSHKPWVALLAVLVAAVYVVFR